MKDLKYIVIIVLLILITSVLTVVTIKNLGVINNYKESIETYKKGLIEKDETIKLDSVNYLKVVNDLHTEKSLNDLLKSDNKELYKKANKYKLLYYGSITTDTTKSSGTPEVKYIQGNIELTDYFPNKANPFIKYRYNGNGEVGESDFTLNPIKLSYIVRENTLGIKEVIFETPEFLSVSNIQLNTVNNNTNNTNRNRFSLSIGAGYVRAFNANYIVGRVGVQNGRMLYDAHVNKDIILLSTAYQFYVK